MSVKLFPLNALYIIDYLSTQPMKSLPPAWAHGKKAENLKMLAANIVSGEDCPFLSAKSSTVSGWVTRIFQCVDILGNLVAELINSGKELNLNELEVIIMNDEEGAHTTLELLSAHFDVQKLLGIV